MSKEVAAKLLVKIDDSLEKLGLEPISEILNNKNECIVYNQQTA